MSWNKEELENIKKIFGKYALSWCNEEQFAQFYKYCFNKEMLEEPVDYEEYLKEEEEMFIIAGQIVLDKAEDCIAETAFEAILCGVLD